MLIEDIDEYIKNGTPVESGEKIPAESPENARVFLNTNTPWSAFVCGLQGSGKSHTLSCLIGKSILTMRMILPF